MAMVHAWSLIELERCSLGATDGTFVRTSGIHKPYTHAAADPEQQKGAKIAFQAMFTALDKQIRKNRVVSKAKPTILCSSRRQYIERTGREVNSY